MVFYAYYLAGPEEGFESRGRSPKFLTIPKDLTNSNALKDHV